MDFNATAPLSPAAAEAMAAAAGGPPFGNPSSIHAEGRRARDLVERARDRVAGFVGCAREQVVFTSGGTEANRLGVELLAGEGVAVEVAAWEHPSLTGLRRPGGPASVVAFGLVNHETGAIYAVPQARAIHCDAVQAAGKLDLAPVLARVDTLAISAHKLGGPQGVGALIVRDPDRVPPHEHGHQERGRRAGTENVLGIVGFGAALAARPSAPPSQLDALHRRLEAGILAIPGARIHAADLPRVPTTTNCAFAGARGESIVIALDLLGVAASTGAACTSGSTQPSPVLRALGLPRDRALEAVRFSLGPTTTEAEIDRVLAVLPGIVERARSVVSTAHA